MNTKFKTGVLLLNLGTPDEPSKRGIKRFLSEFLSDRRVMDLPWVVRQVLLKSIILPFRASKTTKAYEKIWDKNHGSPLLFHSRNFSKALETYLGEDYLVEIGMRYGQPNILGGIQRLQEQGCSKLILIPLFPQYSSAANGSAIEKVLSEVRSQWVIPDLIILSSFYQHQAYIEAQAKIIEPYLQSYSPDKVLFSYHSLPVRHIVKAKTHCFNACSRSQSQSCVEITVKNQHCYRAQCFETSKQIAMKIDLQMKDYDVVFQSRLGGSAWIGPDIQQTLPSLIQQGVKKLLIVCPSFVVDCLETLEEVGMRVKEQWDLLGGEEFVLVPCLNSHPAWIKGLGDYLRSV